RARNTRIKYREKRVRKKAVKKLFLDSKLIDQSFLDKFDKGQINYDTWNLRANALDKPISNEELFTIVLHLVKNRGYIVDYTDLNRNRSGKRKLKAFTSNKKAMQQYRTYGEFIYHTNKDTKIYRNKKGSDDKSIMQDSIEDELKLILEAQQKFGNILCDKELSKKVFDIFYMHKDRDKKVSNDKPIHTPKVKSKLLPPYKIIPTVSFPTLTRSISKLRKTINAIIRQYGSLDDIIITIDDEFEKKKQRDAIKKLKKQDLIKKENAIALLEATEFPVNFKNILKTRLYLEQDKKSLYSEIPIEFDKLFDDEYIKVSHIIPLYKSIDDSISNKTLNFEGETKDDNFKDRIKLSRLSEAKKAKLLKTLEDKDTIDNYIDTHLYNKTKAANIISDYINNYLEFNSPLSKAVVIKSSLLRQMQIQWQTDEISNNGFELYTKFACITAFCTDENIDKLLKYYKTDHGNSFDTPYINFAEDIAKITSEAMTVRLPKRKVTGEAHLAQPTSKKLWLDTKGELKPGIEINGGMCQSGEVKKINIYKKDDKFYFQLLTIIDIASKNHKKPLLGENMELHDIDDSFKFVTDLYKDDLISVKYKSRAGKIEELNKMFFLYMRPSNGKMNLLGKNTIKRRDNNKSFTAFNLVEIKKHHLDLLGF
ncbi:MAG: HNH endonuclease domain-containing protein, partial [Campylobacterota bacterium]|nr:HNH endonuclease domain-containing protein [Campylobacterota bacterium]